MSISNLRFDEGISKVNSDLHEPLNYLLWINDLEAYGIEGYAYNTGAIILELLHKSNYVLNSKISNNLIAGFTDDVIIGKHIAKLAGIDARTVPNFNYLLNNEELTSEVAKSKAAMDEIVKSDLKIQKFFAAKDSCLDILISSDYFAQEMYSKKINKIQGAGEKIVSKFTAKYAGLNPSQFVSLENLLGVSSNLNLVCKSVKSVLACDRLSLLYMGKMVAAAGDASYFRSTSDSIYVDRTNTDKEYSGDLVRLESYYMSSGQGDNIRFYANTKSTGARIFEKTNINSNNSTGKFTISPTSASLGGVRVSTLPQNAYEVRVRKYTCL